MTTERDEAGRDPLDTLREELERVSVSDGFADRVRERIAADQAVDLAPIESELAAVSVSAAFAANVRRRTAVSTRAVPRFRGSGVPGFRGAGSGSGFGFWFAGLAAAATVLAFSVYRAGDGGDVPPATPATRVAVAAPSPQFAEPALETRTGTRTGTRTPAPRNPGTRPGTRTRTPAPRNPGTPEPKFEVITNQPQILAELWAAATRVEATQVVAPIAAIDTVAAPLELDLATVEVAPVVVKWLVEPPPAVGFPLPIILRIAAAEAARRPE